ncbi:hypothetical protein A0H81_13148 [Grifola frondosa]|uniref:Uncharacterized protein n=1 Tax=Grifola frondosa TaxID=5627 RepID=A0A1C7LQ67_GRIFR|nr:hypothetical protein A0H81_13148 [Grifola frondosa]
MSKLSSERRYPCCFRYPLVVALLEGNPLAQHSDTFVLSNPFNLKLKDSVEADHIHMQSNWKGEDICTNTLDRPSSEYFKMTFGSALAEEVLLNQLIHALGCMQSNWKGEAFGANRRPTGPSICY